MSSAREKGLLAEAKAKEYLLAIGWQIIATNERFHFGEIDVIAKDGEDLVFVEVKSRQQLSHFEEFPPISAQKLRRLWKLAHIYWDKNFYTLEHVRDIRLDCLWMQGGRVHAHLRDLQTAPLMRRF